VCAHGLVWALGEQASWLRYWAALPRLRGGEPIELRGYPIHMVHAEKIVTAIQRGTANTRWRDFGDV
jgi:hypothetical protein